MSDTLTDGLVAALNVSLMLAVGFDLEPSRIGKLLRRWGLLSYALFLNFVAVPLLGWGLTQWLPLSGVITTGMILVAISPGGGTGTLLTKMARADLELSVVMLFPLTALSVVLTPLWAGALLGGKDLSIPMGSLFFTLVVLQLTPLLAGVFTRRLSPAWAALGHKVASPLANLLLALLVVGLLISRGSQLKAFTAPTLLALLILAAVSMAVGFLGRFDRRQKVAISLTTGVRSVSLALLLASLFFHDATTILTVLTYALFMYGVGIPIALISRRRAPQAS